jgi:ribosomal protein L11 methyltransferase
MSNYCEITIAAATAQQQEVLIAQLAEMGYDGFEELNEGLKAFIPEESFSEHALKELLVASGLGYTKFIIPKQNWNRVWESNFEPVLVDDFVGVRAGFHPPFEQVLHEIVITPKMSFGTGHHATTYMMMQLMRELDFNGKSVYDFGTGTGILAILAQKLGAGSVLAVDNDDWCIENATENAGINGVGGIKVEKIDILSLKIEYDIILANINKNVIIENINMLKKGLAKNGQLLLSGLLNDDESDIHKAVQSLDLQHIKTIRRNNWIAIWYR